MWVPVRCSCCQVKAPLHVPISTVTLVTQAVTVTSVPILYPTLTSLGHLPWLVPSQPLSLLSALHAAEFMYFASVY